MRPLRIEMEGFAAFRERAIVDLDDTDLFALVGPTGAGKSSVIDAMVFALYGSVPRYGSKGLVYPVITQGALEARVRLDFVVGSDTYTATRVVRRTKTGASTKEARLERGGEVLAEDADGLTAAVADLLGLDLEQFTKCVVLPQGAFATLLHDTKATRQDLLVKLLDLGLYERLAAAARAEAKGAGQRIELLDEQLARSADATPEAVAEAATRIEELDALVAAVDATGPTLDALAQRITEADAAIDEARRAVQPLTDVVAPPDLDAVVRAATTATERVEITAHAEQEAARAVAAAAAALEALPEPEPLRSTLTDLARLDELDASVARGTELLDEVDAAVDAARTAVDSASAAQREAEAARDRARTADVAADLARHLHEGDDCPVCGNRIDELVAGDGGTLADAENTLQRAAKALHEATAHLVAEEKKQASYRAKLDERVSERRTVQERVADAPLRQEIEATLEEITSATGRLKTLRTADEAARAAAADARSTAERASGALVAARQAFTRTRDAVAAFGPPAPTDDLAADWSALTAWAADELRRRNESVDAAAERRTVAVAERDATIARLAGLATDAGVVAEPPTSLRDRCVEALAGAKARHEHLASEAAAAGELRSERDRLDARRQVHDLLAEQLGARGFEAWLLDEALDALLAGASDWLERLSSGRYAMAVDDKKQFAVIDHANADERRLARTLSGGETFLASLALALALAERVSELSATGGATLDAIFLDEGFGTLDPDTLDVVATAIEELGATGRMVGIISHVAELAERVPVRFEVDKAPGTSAIRRVDA